MSQPYEYLGETFWATACVEAELEMSLACIKAVKILGLREQEGVW